MRHLGLGVFVVGLMLFGCAAASSDPANWPQVALIIQWLEHIDRTLRDVNLIKEDIRGRLNSVYPLDVLRKIEPYFEPVDSIRNPDASPSTEARPSAGGTLRSSVLTLLRPSFSGVKRARRAGVIAPQAFPQNRDDRGVGRSLATRPGAKGEERPWVIAEC
jgi:hypothetical protein